MRVLCLVMTLIAGTTLAGGEMKQHTIDVPNAEPVTIVYPASWNLSSITPKVPPGKIPPPAIMFTSTTDKEFWIRIVFMSAELTRMTTQEAVDANVQQAAARCLEGKLPPDLKLQRFKTKDGFGSYAELKDPKWDGKEHAPGEYHLVITGGSVTGKTGAGITMTTTDTNSPCYTATIELITKGITTIRQAGDRTK